jgi:hypothetical protein
MASAQLSRCVVPGCEKDVNPDLCHQCGAQISSGKMEVSVYKYCLCSSKCWDAFARDHLLKIRSHYAKEDDVSAQSSHPVFRGTGGGAVH